MIEHALAYAGLGWRVFPCHYPLEGGQCSCGTRDCRDNGKHPITEHGFKDASCDEASVRAWWTKFPNANIGVATGQGLAALDFDGLQHEASWPAVVKATLTANTPRSRTG